MFWESQGSRLIESSVKKDDGCTRSMYTINILDASHNGQKYDCQVTNGVGSTPLSTITLNVQGECYTSNKGMAGIDESTG